MTKRPLFYFLISLMLLLGTVALNLLPDPVKPFVQLFCPVLFATVLCGILCGSLSALAVGVLSPFLVHLLTGEGNLVPDVLINALSYGISGFLVGIFYNWKQRLFISVLLFLLTSRLLSGVTCLFYYLAAGHYYSLNDYFTSAVKDIWPGLLFTLAAVPLLVIWLGKNGILRILGKDYM